MRLMSSATSINIGNARNSTTSISGVTCGVLIGAEGKTYAALAK